MSETLSLSFVREKLKEEGTPYLEHVIRFARQLYGELLTADQVSSLVGQFFNQMRPEDLEQMRAKHHRLPHQHL